MQQIHEINKIFIVYTTCFSELDLKEISINDLKETFMEFKKYECDFKDCNHDLEKGCKVKEALEKGEILPSRYINYIRFLKEIYENSSKLYK